MTPMELDKRDFKKAVRGYSEDEVDYFLAQVRADYEELYKENQDVKAQLADYEQNMGKYKSLEHTLNNTLIVAQQTAEELKRNAEKAAELILEEAKLKAQQRVHEADAEVRKLALQKEELLKRIQELKIRLRAFLRAQLDLLEQSGDVEDTLTVEKPKPQPVKVEEPKVEYKQEAEPKQEVKEEAQPETKDPNAPVNINYSWTRDEENANPENNASEK